MKPEERKIPPEAILSAICLSILVFLLSMQVILRFCFGRTLAWSEEAARFAFVWAVYFGFVLAAYEDKHIRVTAALWIFPEKIQLYFLTFADFLWTVFNVIMVYFGIVHVFEMIEYPYISQTLGINLLYVYAIVPIGFLWMGVRVIQSSIKRLQGKSEIQDSRLDTA